MQRQLQKPRHRRAIRLPFGAEAVRDDIQGGVLATLIAAPLMIVCCGGGGIALTGIIGAVGGWIGGVGSLAAVLMAVVAALAWRSRQRARAGCCEPRISSERSLGT